MTRDQQIERAARLRKNKTTVVVGRDEHGRRYAEKTVRHESISLAKKNNGLNAVALQRGEDFPPTLEQLPAIEETAAV